MDLANFSKFNVLNESTLAFVDVDGKYMMEIDQVLKPGGYKKMESCVRPGSGGVTCFRRMQRSLNIRGEHKLQDEYVLDYRIHSRLLVMLSYSALILLLILLSMVDQDENESGNPGHTHPTFDWVQKDDGSEKITPKKPESVYCLGMIALLITSAILDPFWSRLNRSIPQNHIK
uniref:Uncharacterized protein n=1 Tax=Lactuca sativa TaxID=4236 RepID=A0A9R1UNB9_LACSA|nr:hypothetical protein LSAT_V11C800422140 [Lactuca sativa]